MLQVGIFNKIQPDKYHRILKKWNTQSRKWFPLILPSKFSIQSFPFRSDNSHSNNSGFVIQGNFSIIEDNFKFNSLEEVQSIQRLRLTCVLTTNSSTPCHSNLTLGCLDLGYQLSSTLTVHQKQRIEAS